MPTLSSPEYLGLTSQLGDLAQKLKSLETAGDRFTIPLEESHQLFSLKFMSQLESRISEMAEDNPLYPILIEIQRDAQEIEITLGWLYNLIHDFSAYSTGTYSLDILMLFQESIEKIEGFLLYLRNNIENIDSNDVEVLKSIGDKMGEYNTILDEIYTEQDNLREQIKLIPQEVPNEATGRTKAIMQKIDTTCKEISDILGSSQEEISYPPEVLEVTKEIRFSLQVIFATQKTQGLIPHMDMIEGIK